MTGLTGPTATSRGAIASHLEEELLSGRLPAGTKLPSERQLAARLGVSRPVVREVIRTLVERGLLEVSPGRGAYARAMEPIDIAAPMTSVYRRRNATPRDLVEARTMLESETAAYAAGRATPAAIDELSVLVVRIDEATDAIEKARADVAFHARLARASGNPVIETMFVSITGLAFEHMLRSSADPQIAAEANPYHAEVVEAIRAGDAVRARKAMRDHLAVATERYGDDLDVSIQNLAQRELDRMQVPPALRISLLGEAQVHEPSGDDLRWAPSTGRRSPGG
ncbi:MAG TPA: FadR/GntR family transcriptional regulator [Propionibacteriaceae bacterium]|jgi:GntR family transcriptional repressor for pyruvate dehydrogenase complex